MASAVQDDIPVLNREKVITVYIKPEIWSKTSSINLIERVYRAMSNETYLKLVVTPKDRFANLIGPGNADLLQKSVGQNHVLKIVDNLDGSYEMEMMMHGDYQGDLNLQPTFRSLSTDQERSGETTIVTENPGTLQQSLPFSEISPTVINSSTGQTAINETTHENPNTEIGIIQPTQTTGETNHNTPQQTNTSVGNEGSAMEAPLSQVLP